MIVISRIVGGIGNQLFQYASSTAFAKARGAKLYFDTSSFEHKNYVNPEGYLLRKVFDVENPEATKADLFKVLGVGSLLLPIRFRLNFELVSRNYFVEKVPYAVEEKFFSFGGNHCYLEGYWQNEKYFEDIRKSLLSKLTFRHDILSRKAKKIASKLKKENSVSVHVRRGDYVNNKVYESMYYTCGERYYRSAFEFLDGKLANPTYYVFSDDIQWARNQEYFQNCEFIDTDTGSGSWNDLFMMSCCQHNIIANSSFSWWGAWLNDNDSKVVVAPNSWFKSGHSWLKAGKNEFGRDFLSSDWHVI